MRLGTSVILILASFGLGFFMRPKIAPTTVEQITFTSKAPAPPPKSEVVAGRAPQSVSLVQEASLVKPVRETINGIDIVQAMLNKDMAKVYAAHRVYEQAWRHQFIESHAQKLGLDERLKLETALVRALPVQKEDNERLFRGRRTLNVDGKKVYIDVIMSVSLSKEWLVQPDQKRSEYTRPCFRLDGYIAVDKTVERLNFDQVHGCSESLYERLETAFIGVDNYRRKSGSVINMLLIPANPADQLALEYLTGNSADWKKDNDSFWQAADPESWNAFNNLMVSHALAAGMNPGSLYESVTE